MRMVIGRTIVIPIYCSLEKGVEHVIGLGELTPTAAPFIAAMVGFRHL
jgi:hypothetical protein